MSAGIAVYEAICNPPAIVIRLGKVLGCVLNITHVIIGVVFLDECPGEPKIPMYLVVMGVFGLLLSLLSCLPCAEAKKGPGANNVLHNVCFCWNALVTLFITCWFFCGNVWVYRIYEPVYVKNATTLDIYCNKTVYLYAFWTITLVYILIGAILVGGCCFLIGFILIERANSNN